MNATQAFWIREYANKARSPDPFVQSGRAAGTDPVAFVHAVRRMILLLSPQPGDAILEIGCANGLMAIPLSGLCRHVLAVERVRELAAMARAHTRDCGNVDVVCADAATCIAPDRTFDRALIWEALQLIDPNAVRGLFVRLAQCLRPGGRIVVGSIPDARHRSAFLGQYLANVRDSERLTEAEKRAIIARNERAHWYHPDDLAAWWVELGGRACVLRALAHQAGADHRFDLVVDMQA